MRDSFQFTEPHPSIAPTTSGKSYIMTGRGGAGNYAKYDTSKLTHGPTATGPAARSGSTSGSDAASSSSSVGLSPAPSARRTVHTTGRGGFGNRFRTTPSTEMAIFSFDEELERQQKMLDGQAPVFTVGRGGAGNVVDGRRAGSDRSSLSSEGSTASGSGQESRVRRSLDRLGRTFSRS